MALLHETFSVGRLGCNCTVAVCSETGEALVVDPGDDAARIRVVLARLGGRVTKVVHTHAHLDHVLASHDVAEQQADVLLHPGDRWLWDHVPQQGALFGWPVSALAPPTGDLTDGAALTFGRCEAQVVHTPGHTPGSTCFFLAAGQGQTGGPGNARTRGPGAERTTVGAEGAPAILLSGDTLFRESVGRTDLWGTSFEELARSIRERLFTLGDDTAVVPGHGAMTTIGHERQENPFLR